MATQEQADLFQRHIQGKIRNPRCPVCDAMDWALRGPAAMMIYEEPPESPPLLKPNAIPVVLMTCKNCQYVHTFMWKTIEDNVNGKG